MDVIERKKFGEIDLSDTFFDTLRNDYPGFDDWFNKKAIGNEDAYILDECGIQGFLYLKEETGCDDTVEPRLEYDRKLKVGTFKINAHGTKLGERFIKIVIDEMYKEKYQVVYVTIFDHHSSLINLLTTYGFIHYGVKNSRAGIEQVFIKYADNSIGNIYFDFPRVNIEGNKKLMLAIYPEYHTRMFPNSKLKTEREHIVEDTPYTNSIEKVYLSAINLSQYKKGDVIVIYRTADEGKKAEYSSVATSVCTIIEVKYINDFVSYEIFLQYCLKNSVFTETELEMFWKTKRYKYVVKMLYNIALKKRITRHDLIEAVGLDRGQRWSVVALSDLEFNNILELGEVDESFIID